MRAHKIEFSRIERGIGNLAAVEQSNAGHVGEGAKAGKALSRSASSIRRQITFGARKFLLSMARDRADIVDGSAA